MDDRSMLATSAVLRGEGFDVVRFNFLYREKRSGRPDPMPRLLTCFGAVLPGARRAAARAADHRRPVHGRPRRFHAGSG